ncbi:hypothetical protein CLAFUR0_08879 [Fulvia fulva]|nr:hypothetical protein CLAFUR0_08879 [Fulvia fulva]
MSTATVKTRTIYHFLEPTFIENIVIRPNGHLLLTTFREGSVYNLDPNAASPVPELVAKLPGTTALTGIVQIEYDTYAVTGGIKAGSMKFEKSTMKVFDRLLGLSELASKGPLGANGAKVRDGYFYFTNSAQELFCKVKVDSQGDTTGDIEIVTHNEEAKHNMPYDDFDFDSEGNAWITVHSESIYRIDPGGRQTLFIGGDGSPLQGPTSLAVSKDDTKLYVACAGNMGKWRGSVVEVHLP